MKFELGEGTKTQTQNPVPKSMGFYNMQISVQINWRFMTFFTQFWKNTHFLLIFPLMAIVTKEKLFPRKEVCFM